MFDVGAYVWNWSTCHGFSPETKYFLSVSRTQVTNYNEP